MRDEYGNLKESFMCYDSGKIKPSFWVLMCMVFVYLMSGIMIEFNPRNWEHGMQGLFSFVEICGLITYIAIKFNVDEDYD